MIKENKTYLYSENIDSKNLIKKLELNKKNYGEFSYIVFKISNDTKIF